MANWHQLPLDLQKEIIRDLPIRARARLYQTSSQIPQVSYDCCFEPTMKEIIAYLLQQQALLQNLQTRHLNTLNVSSESDRTLLHFTDQSGIDFTIIIDIQGYFYLGSKEILLNKLIDKLSAPGVELSRKHISNVIKILRPVLYNRLSCVRQDPDFADKCFLQLLPNYLNADDLWFVWRYDIEVVGRNLLRNPEILYAAAENESSKWNKYKKKLPIKLFDYDTLVDGILVKQWLSNWLRNLPVSELKPLISF